MKNFSLDIAVPPDAEAVSRLQEAVDAKKCWRCGCLRSSLEAIDRAIPVERRSSGLADVIEKARTRLVPVQYDCLGCEVCYPPLAMNALQIDAEACPSEKVEVRSGWPPLPGAYTVLQYQAPVAVCTLTDETLAVSVAAQRWPEVSIVGNMYTENLGIERLIQNIIANPNLRFLILCGTDSRQAVGHLPGQSLLALAQCGAGESGRIIEAKGKRPILRNISREMVEHFRQTVEIVNLVGVTELAAIAQAAAACALRNPGPAVRWLGGQSVPIIPGYLPDKMVSDPAGYFVVYVDRPKRRLALEHYQNTGVLDVIIEGSAASELYVPAVERKLVSRLEHAAYLGRELARAERSLGTNELYVQDAAPEREPIPAACGCGTADC
ncbi:MAG: DUF4346 domain-containing protein [Phycisphaerae bacterium]